MAQKALQYLPIVDSYPKFADSHLLEYAVNDAWDFGLGQITQGVSVDDVDVTLIELAKPAFPRLRILTAPDSLNLISTERKCQFAFPHCDIAGKGNRQVEPQCPLCRRIVIIAGGQSC